MSFRVHLEAHGCCSYPSGLVTGRMKKSNMLRSWPYSGRVTRLFIT